MTRAGDLTGRRFRKLKVLYRTRIDQRSYYWCRCDCGTEKEVCGGNLASGNTVSCGCFRETSPITHGASKTKAYKVWCWMIRRCTKPKAPDYPRYGGRGIKVCKRWLKFENFLKDMGQPPKGLSIDRIDNDGDYKPSNCRWATMVQQARNSRKSRFVTVDGVRKTISEWAEHVGVSQNVIHMRLHRNWSAKRAVFAPLRKARH